TSRKSGNTGYGTATDEDRSIQAAQPRDRRRARGDDVECRASDLGSRRLRPPDQVRGRLFGPRADPRLSEHVLVDAEAGQDLARDFLDRGMRRALHRYAVAAEQLVGLGKFMATLFDRRVAAARATRLAHLGEALRIDGEAVQALPVRRDALRELEFVEIVLGERIIGRLDAVMQRHVQAGRRLADPR